MTETVELPYAPREIWRGLHQTRKRWVNVVAHRRSGKTFSMLAEGVARALEGPANGHYIYCAPFLGQSKAIAWDILRHIAQPVTTKTSEVELWVDLVNGARIRLFGADRPDALRGLPCHGLLADEYADWAETVFEEILLPMLADTRGWGIFGGTPKGRNHFHEQHEKARRHPDWHSELLPVSVTKLISEDELAAIQLTMSPEVYAQEFLCSFVAPRSGSIWGEQVERAIAEGRVGDYPYDPSLPVSIATDIGYTDATACWYFQDMADGVQVIDYDEFTQRELTWWLALWEAKGYQYNTVWLPHDARNKSFQTGRSVVELLLASDVPCKVTPHSRKRDSIEAGRWVFPRCRFNEPTTQLGMKRLSNYRYSYNAKTKAYGEQPLHDENSHGGDAFRYMAQVCDRREATQFDTEAPLIQPVDRRFQLEVLWADRASRRPQGARSME
jgi:hypothetical protein